MIFYDFLICYFINFIILPLIGPEPAAKFLSQAQKVINNWIL